MFKFIPIKIQCMKKVLILTYFFPPGSFAGSHRAASWVEHLHEFDLYPVVVTRHWDEGQDGFSDISGKRTIQVDKGEHAEVHYLPYRGNLRDKILRKSKDRFAILRRFLSLCEILFQNITNRIIPFRNLYLYSKKILKEQPDIDIVVVTAKPFILFRFGYMLKKHFSYLRWIADYRDPWNTNEYSAPRSNSFIRAIERYSEKKWVSSAAMVTSCSELWCRQIESFTGKEARVVLNGYDHSLALAAKSVQIPQKNAEFTIGYNGTLYPMQHIDNIIDPIINLIKSGKQKIRVCFWGIENNPEQADRIKKKIQGYEPYFQFTGRLPKDELNRNLLRSDLLIIFGITQLKGCYSVKIFEYLAAGKPILMSPSDHDVAEALIKDTRSGYVCETAAETETMLQKLYREFMEKGTLDHKPDKDKIAVYSRQYQTGVLAKIIREIS
jgi:glycosyltransferase involved in cell wall biosynthesis